MFVIEAQALVSEKLREGALTPEEGKVISLEAERLRREEDFGKTLAESLTVDSERHRASALINDLPPETDTFLPPNYAISPEGVFLQAGEWTRLTRTPFFISGKTRTHVSLYHYFNNEWLRAALKPSECDMDHTFDFLASLYFSFLFIDLTRYADRSGGELPVTTNFLLDEFCNIGYIPDFNKKISTMRGRGIACSVIFQSIVQLMGFYPDKEWETILADCDSWLILGVKDVTSAEYISKHLGVGTIKTESVSRSVGKVIDLGKNTSRYEKRNLMNPDEVTRMPKSQAILSAFGLKPLKLEKLDFTKHPMSKLLQPQPVSLYKREWSEKYKPVDDPLDRIIEEILHDNEDTPGIYPPIVEPAQNITTSKPISQQDQKADAFWS
jgi:hypothetical protein